MLRIINNTIVSNHGTIANLSAIANADSSFSYISNTILWGNDSGVINDANSSSFITYSLIQGLSASTANHNLDGTVNPLFVDTFNNNYQLLYNSPCINTGNNDSIPIGITTDLTSNNRIWDTIVDIGAYEYSFSINLGNDTAICTLGEITLDAYNEGSAYVWNTGDTTQIIAVNNTGTYTVEISNTWGTVTDTIQINISSPPVVMLGNDTSIIQGSSLTLNAGNPGATYLWNTGATTQTITVTTGGTYSVIVTTSGGCTGTDTIVVNINPLGINNINTSENRLILSPNPSKETVNISFTDEKMLHTKAILTDIYGRTVREVMLNSKPQQLSMAGLSSGVYILKTINGGSAKIIKE